MKDRYLLSLLGLGTVAYAGFAWFMVSTMVARAERIDAEIRPHREKASTLIAGLDGFPEDVSEADWYIAAKMAGADRGRDGEIGYYQKIIGKLSRSDAGK